LTRGTGLAVVLPEGEDDSAAAPSEADTERRQLERDLIRLYYLRADLIEHDRMAALSLDLTIDILTKASEGRWARRLPASGEA
jgi:hypothetical protein